MIPIHTPEMMTVAPLPTLRAGTPPPPAKSAAA
jgi:hypothetical protein